MLSPLDSDRRSSLVCDLLANHVANPTAGRAQTFLAYAAPGARVVNNANSDVAQLLVGDLTSDTPAPPKTPPRKTTLSAPEFSLRSYRSLSPIEQYRCKGYLALAALLDAYPLSLATRKAGSRADSAQHEKRWLSAIRKDGRCDIDLGIGETLTLKIPTSRSRTVEASSRSWYDFGFVSQTDGTFIPVDLKVARSNAKSDAGSWRRVRFLLTGEMITGVRGGHIEVPNGSLDETMNIISEYATGKRAVPDDPYDYFYLGFNPDKDVTRAVPALAMDLASTYINPANEKLQLSVTNESFDLSRTPRESLFALADRINEFNLQAGRKALRRNRIPLSDGEEGRSETLLIQALATQLIEQLREQNLSADGMTVSDALAVLTASQPLRGRPGSR